MRGTNNDSKNTDQYKLPLNVSNQTEKSNFYHHFQTVQLHFELEKEVDEKNANQRFIKWNEQKTLAKTTISTSWIRSLSSVA